LKRLSFSDDMMRALAAGEKTMTRRPEKRAVPADAFRVIDGPAIVEKTDGEVFTSADRGWLKPRFKVGDLVAATCAYLPPGAYGDAVYRFHDPAVAYKWNSSRIMPAALAPFVLRITEVRAERLGDISEQDARREGAVQWFEREAGISTKEKNICAGDCFAELWCHVYGAGAWDRNFNSWVWAIGFEIAERRI
jgi:hypothetical protein